MRTRSRNKTKAAADVLSDLAKLADGKPGLPESAPAPLEDGKPGLPEATTLVEGKPGLAANG
jgi:hypothetical protein